MTSSIQSTEKPSGRFKPGLGTGIAAMICIAGAIWVFYGSRPDNGPGRGGPQAIPVTLATVASADVPVYVSGPGNVQALNTVTVNSRVDGQIQKIAFKEGQDVKTGDLLVQIDPRPFQAALDQAVARQAQDTAQLKNAELDLDRYSKLASDNYASKQQLDSQQATVDQLKAQLQSDQAAIDNARTQLGYTSITAPIPGRTGLRLVDEGNIIHASDTSGIVTIVQTRPIAAIVSIPERHLPDIAAAARAGAVPVAAFGEGNKVRLAEGTLELIDNKVDQNTGTIKIKATFANADGKLWPGQFVNVRLLVRTLTGATVTPDNAVLRGQSGLYVYVVKPDSTVEARAVTVGPSANGLTVIEKGLSVGDRVVSAGQSRLYPNARVEASGAPSELTTRTE